jgi:hypothetical protein
MKTKKGGYLKDGFVVDSSDTEEILDSEDETEDDEEETDETTDIEEPLILEELGSELSEEEYDYSDSDK